MCEVGEGCDVSRLVLDVCVKDVMCYQELIAGRNTVRLRCEVGCT